MPRLLALLVLLGAAACGTRIAYMPTNASPRALTARPVSEVEVFTSGKPARAYVEVGLIEAQQESQYSTDSEMGVFGKLREEAARQGCDGLILLGANDATWVSGSTTGYGRGSVSGGTLRGYRGTCIVYTDASP